jgi:hypothetical protein
VVRGGGPKGRAFFKDPVSDAVHRRFAELSRELVVRSDIRERPIVDEHDDGLGQRARFAEGERVPRSRPVDDLGERHATSSSTRRWLTRASFASSPGPRRRRRDPSTRARPTTRMRCRAAAPSDRASRCSVFVRRARSDGSRLRRIDTAARSHRTSGAEGSRGAGASLRSSLPPAAVVIDVGPRFALFPSGIVRICPERVISAYCPELTQHAPRRWSAPHC